MKIIITVKDTNNIIGLKEDIAMRLEGIADKIIFDIEDSKVLDRGRKECS